MTGVKEARSARNRYMTVVLLVLLVAGNVAGIVVPAGSAWDFANFYDAGSRVAAGEIDDLYRQDSLIAGRPHQGSLAFFGTPLSAWLYAPLAPLRPDVALLVFKAQNALAYALGLWLLLRFCRRLADPRRVADGGLTVRFLAACLLFQPFWSVYRVGGQTTPTVFLLLVLGMLAHTEGRHPVSAAAFGTAVLIKPSYVLGHAALVALSAPAFALASAAFFALAAVVSVATMGWEIQLEFVRWMLEHASLVARWFYNSSLYVPLEEARRWWYGSAATPEPGALFRGTLGLVRLAVLAGLLRVVLRARHRWGKGPGREGDAVGTGPISAARRHFRFVVALSAFLLLSLTVWEHYLTTLFLLLAYLLAVDEELAPRLRRAATAIVLLGVVQSAMLVELLRDHLTVTSLPGVLAAGVVKSAPLLLTALIWFGCADELLRTWEGAAWTRYEGRRSGKPDPRPARGQASDPDGEAMRSRSG